MDVAQLCFINALLLTYLVNN